MTLRKILTTVAALFLTATLAACGWLDHKQKEWIFNVSDRTWGGYTTGAHGFEDVIIPVGADEHIHAWWAPAPQRVGNPARTVLYLHGTRWNLSGSANRIARWRDWGYNVLAIDYRGFGRSSPGQPSETKTYEDARAALAWLRATHPDPRGYVLVGHSLGGAVAIDVAANDGPVALLVTEATFTSMKSMAERTPARYLPLSMVLTQRFDSVNKIAKVKAPMLIVHGTDDTLIPVSMAQELYARATSAKELLLVPGGTHHNLAGRAGETYLQAVGRLLQQASTPL
jgi:uncharacterized protein